VSPTKGHGGCAAVAKIPRKAANGRLGLGRIGAFTPAFFFPEALSAPAVLVIFPRCNLPRYFCIGRWASSDMEASQTAVRPE
jgi:hypothetical protein